MKLSKEVKTGLVVLITIVLFIYGFNLLKGRNLLGHERKYYVVYHNVDGLVSSNPVVVNGLKVGQVKSLLFAPGTSGKIIATIIVTQKELDIQSNTIARIFSSDLLGSKAINLDLKPGGRIMQNGDTLIGETEQSLSKIVDQRIEPLRKKVESLVGSIDSVMIGFNAVLDKDGRSNLSKSFESIRKAIATFEKTSVRLDELVASEQAKVSKILSKVEIITTTFANNSEQLGNVIKNFSTISDSLAKSNIATTINNATAALGRVSEVMDKINKGEGSLGLLVNDKKLYNHLDSASVSLDKLLEDLKARPGRYVHLSVFGKKDQLAPAKK